VKGVLLQANLMLRDYNGHTLEEMPRRGTDKVDMEGPSIQTISKRHEGERRSGLASGVPFEIEKRMRWQRLAVSLVSISL